MLTNVDERSLTERTLDEVREDARRVSYVAGIHAFAGQVKIETANLARTGQHPSWHPASRRGA